MATSAAANSMLSTGLSGSYYKLRLLNKYIVYTETSTIVLESRKKLDLKCAIVMFVFNL